MSAATNQRITTSAATRSIHQAFRWLHLHESQLRRWQLELLAIPAPPHHEAARAQWFLQRFQDLGLTNPHIDRAGNALAELTNTTASPAPPCDAPPCADAPCLLLSAHLDTVFPPGTDCTPCERDGVLHGPGACDNGAGLTALLALAAAMRHAGIQPACTILFAANVGEEGGGNLRGMRHLFEDSPYASRIRTAIALEGSGTATVVDRALGSRRLRVTISGPGGHSWADSALPNPILALASALLSIANLPMPQNPRSTLSCGTITGGTSVNSIPALAAAELDIRSTSAFELDRIELAVLSSLSQTMATETRNAALPLTLQVTRIGDRPAGALPAESPLALSLRAVDRHLGINTESHIGSTDANLPLSLGIPALAIGCGGKASGIHTLQEWYDPAGRDLALRRILLLLLDAATLLAQQT